MVYRGKPSGACGECRKRRTKCDQAVPACGQCQRTKRSCPGYRNTVELKFLDQSETVAKRHKAHQLVLRNVSSASDILQTSSPPSATPYRFLLEDVAVKHLMDLLVGRDSRSSQFGYLPQYYSRGGFKYDELKQSMQAVGLASYARSTQRTDLLMPATKSYVAAVRGINNAMSGPDLAGREATLTSVLLLALFEVMILPRTSGLENLRKHLQGAMSIAHLAVTNTALTSMQREILGTVVQSVAITYWIQKLPLPPHFFAMRKEARFHPDSIHAKFLGLIIELIQFHMALEEGSIPSPEATITEAQRLDLRTERFIQGLSKHAPYNSVLAPPSFRTTAYDGVYHVYPARIVAHVWNNLRLSRLRIHQILIDQLKAAASSAPEDDQTASSTEHVLSSEAIISELAADICASVPQLCDEIERLPSHVDQDFDDAKIRRSGPKYTEGEPLLSLSLTTATVELGVHFIYRPGPFKKFTPRPRHTASQPSPDSVYHVYYQLLHLVATPSLPADMKEWIHERVRSIEKLGDQEDLARMKALVQSTRTRRHALISS